MEEFSAGIESSKLRRYEASVAHVSQMTGVGGRSSDFFQAFRISNSFSCPISMIKCVVPMRCERLSYYNRTGSFMGPPRKMAKQRTALHFYSHRHHYSQHVSVLRSRTGGIGNRNSHDGLISLRVSNPNRRSHTPLSYAESAQ